MLLCRGLEPGEARHWYFATPGAIDFDAVAIDPDPFADDDGFDPRTNTATQRRAQTDTYREHLERLILLKGAFGLFNGANSLGLIAAQPLGSGRNWELWECLVHPACRRQGLGALMLEKMAKEFGARGVESLLCFVSPEHEAARGFLAAQGFKVVGRDRDDSGEALVFQRRL